MDTTEPTLFPVDAVDPPEEISPTRRLTIRNAELLAEGRHPATLRPLRAEGGTCAECEHCHRYDWHNRRYIKCGRHRLGESHSEASDIRSSWPACVLFQDTTEASPK